MNITDLRPGDVLLFKATNCLYKLLIKYKHVAIYYTETKHGLPLLIESIGRGVVIRSLFSYEGEEIAVYRPVEQQYGELAAEQAEHLADNPSCWYGYFDIPRYVIPKLILSKLGNILPRKWTLIIKLLAFTYRKNNFYICSELVADAYDKVGYSLVDENTIPLPDDIANSSRLKYCGSIIVKGGIIETTLTDTTYN